MSTASILRSKTFKAALTLVVFIVLYVLIFPSGSDDSLSPEEINSMFQNKDEDLAGIKKVELTAHGLAPPYLDPNTLKPKNWDVLGTTIVRNNEFMRLTSDNPHQAGSIFLKLPIQAESFEMELTFHIHSKARELVADGFAIWFTDRKLPTGDVFGCQNNFNGLGIFVDTYKNGKRGQFPFVNLMMGNGATPYNKDTDGYETRLAGCTARSVLNPRSEVTKARIVYTKNGYFSLDFNYNNVADEWSNCVTLSDVKLPAIKYLGFSAETGDLSENVDLMENRMFALYNGNGGFIDSIEELQQISNDEAAREETSGGRHRVLKKEKSTTKRRTLKRLKNAEKRIKERERQQRKEMYGDENATLFYRLVRKVVFGLKLCLYTVAFVGVVWVASLAYRSRKAGKRGKKHAGLLD